MRDFAVAAGAGRVVDLNDNAGHVGVTASFLGLLRRAPRGPIVAFADQDDVWLPEKLARGVAGCDRAGRAARAVLRPAAPGGRGSQPDPAQRAGAGPLGFPHAMTQNVATGCTVMLNQRAGGPAGRGAASRSQTLHDWWSYLLVSAGGRPGGGRRHADGAVSPACPQRGGRAAVLRAAAPGRRYGAVPARVHAPSSARIWRRLQAQPELLDAAVARGAGPDRRWAARRLGRPGARSLRHPGLKRQRWAETQLFRLWFLLG